MDVTAMGWSLKLGEVAGIRVQVHFTFLIFLAWIVLSGLIAGKSQQVVLAIPPLCWAYSVAWSCMNLDTL